MTKVRSAVCCLLLLFGPGLPAQEDDGDGAAAEVRVSRVPSDAEIQTRIEAIFNEVDDFADIEVRVGSGVATLDGRIPDSKARARALALLDRMEGVVLTLDRMESVSEISAQLAPVARKLEEMGRASAAKLPLFALAVVMALAFWWLGGFVHRRDSWFARLNLSTLARDLVKRVVRLLVVALGVILALEIVDATPIVGAVLGAAGLAGLAIGFAFKSIIENYLAGVLLSMRNPFEIHDEVEINGNRGKVARLTARDTVLVTLDGNHLRIPNGIVINSELLNFSRNPKRRFDFKVGVSVDLDLDEARRIGLETMKGNPGVLAEPKPVVLVEALGDSTVVLLFSAWLDQSHFDFLKTRSETIRLVKSAFDRAGVEMPEPIYRVHLREGESGRRTAPPESGTAESGSPAAVGDREAAKIETDISADRTIDEQIDEDQHRSKERNLLSPEPPGSGESE
ncbi:MAG: mechanosensitive ion channel family protein [Verrucomicrobiales bacterium]